MVPSALARYLQEVGDGEVHVSLALPVEKLRALHHYEVRRKVHPPREGGSAHQYLHEQQQ